MSPANGLHRLDLQRVVPDGERDAPHLPDQFPVPGDDLPITLSGDMADHRDRHGGHRPSRVRARQTGPPATTPRPNSRAASTSPNCPWWRSSWTVGPAVSLGQSSRVRRLPNARPVGPLGQRERATRHCSGDVPRRATGSAHALYRPPVNGGFYAFPRTLIMAVWGRRFVAPHAGPGVRKGQNGQCGPT
jgi:hypothetical protein